MKRTTTVLLFLLIGGFSIAVSQKGENKEKVETLPSDKQALLDFKKRFKDPTGILKSWEKETDPCLDQWAGIECVSARVTVINLPNFGLEGSLPDFSDLISLRSIKMPNNNVTGVLPEAWNQLSFLESVDLRGNQISGPLPQTWSQLGALTILYLNENHLNGTLPADWWLGSFEQLGLSGNRLTGPLPVNWAHMAQIKVLDLSDNQFTGNLPENWASMKELQVLLLNDNAIFGPLPEAWADLERINEIRLSNNRLVGELPSEWGLMHSASALMLNGNNLGGQVPSRWSALSKMCRIDLSNNPFVCQYLPDDAFTAKDEGPGFVMEGTRTAECPSLASMDTQTLLTFKSDIVVKTEGEILSDWEWNSNSACADEWTGIECRNGRVTSLDLSNLDLSGYLSGKLSKLSALQSLKLDRNHFEGILPSEWGHLRFMKYLNVSSNDIGGELPEDWSLCSSLESLDVSNNRLVGELPSQWDTLINLRDLRGANNTLDGQLPYSWSSMRGIKHIHFERNILSGSLPITWSTFASIESIDISQNNIIGPVPVAWSNMTRLKVLNLEGNDALCGGIPVTLPKQLGKANERLSTPCAEHVSEAILLTHFRYEVEDPLQALTLWKAGSPPCLPRFETWPGIRCDDGRVIGVDLTDFQLSGTLPGTMSHLSKLKDLRLGANRFKGSLPNSWSDLFLLEHLNVSNNALDGPLPSEWATLVSLTSLDLSGNQFEGAVPNEWSRMVELRSLNVSDNIDLCGGLPKDLKIVTVISENTTFFESCSSGNDSPLAAPVISILLVAFIVVTLAIWITCFGCCCYNRRKQRSHFKDLMSQSISKSREEKSQHVSPQARSHPDTSGESNFSRRPRSSYSPNARFQLRFEVPSYTTRAVHPYLPSVDQRRQVSWSRDAARMADIRNSSQRRSQPPVVSNSTEERHSQTRTVGFGSMQSVQTPPHEILSIRPRPDPCSMIVERSRSEMEMCRTLMEQPATPQDVQTPVMSVRSAPRSFTIDPRTLPSRIPRCPTPSVASSVKNGASTYRSGTDRSVQSEQRSRTPVVSSPACSPGAPCTINEIALSKCSTASPVPTASLTPKESNHDLSWALDTTIEIPDLPHQDCSSPTSEMMRWLESYYQSGTFDLDDVPPELLSRAMQQNAGPSGRIPSPGRLATLNPMMLASYGLESSTKELLMWLESRIEEVKSSELNRNGRRNIRPRFEAIDTNGTPLYSYKTSSTINEESD